MRDVRVTRRSVLGSVGAVSVSSSLTAQAVGADAGAFLSATAPPRTAPAFDAVLKVGRAQRSAAGATLASAPILGGEIAGPLLSGEVLPGLVEWRIDAPSQSMEVCARFSVRREDGVMVEVRDRAVIPAATAPAAAAGLCTAPELLDAASEMPASPELLVGRLDATRFGSGVVVLRAFRIV